MRKRVRKPLAFLMALLMTLSVFGGQVMAEGTPSSDAAVVTQGDEGAAGDAASAEAEGNDSGQSVQADNAKSAGQQGAGQTDTDAGNTAAVSAEEGKQDAGQTDAQSTDAQSADGQNPDVRSADSQDVDAQSADAQGSDGSSDQQVEYVPEEQPDGVSVKAYAAKGTLPEGAVMKVTMLDAEGETSDQYDEAAAAMEESDVDYAGFLAMDISFYDADGNEIEPEDGAVNVQFEVDESLLPEDVEADSLAVQHLAETDDGIQVETVADAADQTDGNVAVEDEAVKVEFEVERFSYFTITWNYNGYFETYEQPVSVTCYDAETGEQLPDGTAPANITLSSGDTFQFSSDNEDLKIDGYGFERAEYGNQNSPLTSLSLNYSYSFLSGGKWEYSINGGEYTNSKPSVRLYYSKEGPGVYITDTVADDGLFTATLTGIDLTDSDEVTYTWYRSLTNASDPRDWTKVELERVTGDQDNIVNDGQSVNVAYDSISANASGSDRYWYYVTATVMNSDGSQSVYTSESMQVPYYIELQNGSFETPVADHWNNQVSNGTEGLIWQTTGEGTGSHAGADVEIARSTKDIFRDGNQWKTYQQKVEEIYSPSSAADGVQFAELNCEAYGALYQDVMTVPDVQLYWELQHCARQGNDTMALVIMPTEQAEELTARLEQIANSNSNNNSKAKQIRAALDTVADDEGVYVEYITDDTVNWERYTGTYEVGSSQYLTRFFFVAVSTGSGNATVGNLLDDVGFGKNVPEPNDDEGQLTVTKVVRGYTPDENYSVTVNIDADIDDQDSGYTFNAANFQRQSDGSYAASHTFQIQGMTAHTSEQFTVSETVKNAPAGYSETNEVAVGNSSSSSGTSTTATVQAGNGEKVTFTNSYEQTTGNLTIAKAVSGIDENTVGNTIFTFRVERLTGEGSVDENFNESEFTNGQREVSVTGTASIMLENLPVGSYRVTEINPVETIGDYVYQSNDGPKTVEVSGDNDGNVTITNTYKRQDKTLTIEKNVNGNMSSSNEAFTFELTLLAEQGGNALSVEEYQQIASSAGITDSEQNPVGNSSLSFNNEGTATFSLSDGQKLEITVPHGVYYAVTENSKDYEGSVSVDGSGNISDGGAAGVIEQDTTVTFTNTKNINAPTGITRAVIPFAVMVIIALGAVVTFVVRRRIRR